MFRSVDDRMQTIAHAARGHEGSIRKVYDGHLRPAEAEQVPDDRDLLPKRSDRCKPSSTPSVQSHRRAGGNGSRAAFCALCDERIAIAIRVLPGSGQANTASVGKPNVAAIER